MPVLPLIDLLILISWTSFMWAFLHKALWLALGATFTVLGLTPYDFILGGGCCLLFALALAARTWVKANEGALLARNRSYAPSVIDERFEAGQTAGARDVAAAPR